MKYVRYLLVLLVLILLSFPVEAAWANNSYTHRATTTVTNPYHYSLNISDDYGTNNATHVFCNGHCQANFTDVAFYLDNTTQLPHWFEDNTSGKVWVNVTTVGSGTINMYYGNSSLPTNSSGFRTFPAFSDMCDKTGFTEFGTGTITNCVYSSDAAVAHYYGMTWNTAFSTGNSIRMRVKSDATDSHVGFTDEIKDENYLSATDFAVAQIGSTGAKYWQVQESGVLSQTATTHSNTEFYVLEIVRNGVASVIYNLDDVVKYTETVNIPTVDLYPTGKAYQHLGAYQMDWFFVRNFSYPEPVFSTWGSQEGLLISSVYNNFSSDDSSNISLTETTPIFFNLTNTTSVDHYSWFLDGVNQSIDLNESSFLFSNTGEYNVTAIAHNNSGFVDSFTWFVTLPFVLLTPANGSQLSMTYPPMASTVYFSWNTIGYPYYQLVVSRTPSFSMPVSDTYVTDTFKNVSLTEGDYWWKVRSYDNDAGVWGPYSNVFNFTLSDNGVLDGTNIQGTVYELVASGNTAVTDVTVCIYNNLTTWSECQVSLTGYYLFDDLTNLTTYFVYASKTGYDTTTALPVTTGSGTTITRDIQIRRTVNPYIPDYIDASFRLFYLHNNTGYRDAAVEVYKYEDEITLWDDGVTGMNGIISFQLDLHQRYVIHFHNMSTGELLATWDEDIVKPFNNVPIIISGYMTTPGVPNNTVPANITGTWGLYDFTNASLTSNYEIGVKGQGLIMSIIALFMIPYGGIVAMIVIAFGFAYLGLLSYPFVMVSGVFCAAWYLIKREFS